MTTIDSSIAPCMMQDSYREKQIWGVAILGVLTVGTVVCSGNSTFILYLIMILAAKEVNVRTIVKLTCIIQGAMLLSIVVMSQIGIIPDYIFDASTRQRHGLGLPRPRSVFPGNCPAE